MHDANLFRIELNKKTIILSFELTNVKRVNLYLEEVKEFICHDLSIGNIVLDVTIDSGNETALKLIDKFTIVPQGQTSAFLQVLENLKAKVKNGELYVIELNPSFGCYFLAVAEAVRYEQIN